MDGNGTICANAKNSENAIGLIYVKTLNPISSITSIIKLTINSI